MLLAEEELSPFKLYSLRMKPDCLSSTEQVNRAERRKRKKDGKRRRKIVEGIVAFLYTKKNVAFSSGLEGNLRAFILFLTCWTRPETFSSLISHLPYTTASAIFTAKFFYEGDTERRNSGPRIIPRS
jgi:hypothetical protein